MVLQAWFRQLSSETNPLPQAAPWRCIHELTHAAFQASRRCNGTAEVLPSVSKVPGVWRSLSWCLESVMPWRGIMGFTKFGDKRINDLDLLQGYVVGVACLHREIPCRRICIHLASRTSWSSILYPSVCLQRFVPLPSAVFSYVQTSNKPCWCLHAAHFIEGWALSWWHLRCAVFSYVQTPDILWKHLCAPHSIGESHAMSTPSICCFFICTNPNQTSILGSGGNLQLPSAKKKLIELSFKSGCTWWHGPAP